jgi:hypothetical protein
MSGVQDTFFDDESAVPASPLAHDASSVRVRLWILEERDLSMRCATTEPGRGRSWHVVFIPLSQIEKTEEPEAAPANAYGREVILTIPEWLVRKNHLEAL